MNAAPPREQLTQLAALVEALPGWRRVGQVLIDAGFLDQPGLDAALAAQSQRRAVAPIGLLDLLVEQGTLTAEQARQALTEQILTQYLPALGASLQREKLAVAEAEAARRELAESYSIALRTIAGLNAQIWDAAAVEPAPAPDPGRAARAARVPVARPDRRLPLRLIASLGVSVVLGIFLLFTWIKLPALADSLARPFVPLAEPSPAPASPRPTLARPAEALTTRQAERELILLLNGGRLAAGVPALKPDPSLVAIARGRSEDMATRRYFSHAIPPTGQTFLDLLEAAAFPYEQAGENIEFNNADEESTVSLAAREFFDSPEHRRLALSPDYQVVGVGVARGEEARYYTALFVQGSSR